MTGTTSTDEAAVTEGPRRAQAAAAAALAAVARPLPETVEVVSRGVVLVVGPAPRALALARRMLPPLRPVAVVTDHPADAIDPSGMVVARGRVTAVAGSLGRFTARGAAAEGSIDLGLLSPNRDRTFDLVVDLSLAPAIATEVRPPGYYNPIGDAAVEDVLAVLPGQVGTVTKPRYVDYNADICVHSRRGIVGCSRCLESCPAGAIAVDGTGIAVDVRVCQGCGSCTAVCPTGALGYADPPPKVTRQALRSSLAAFHGAGGRGAVVLVHEAGAGAHVAAELAQASPAVLPFAVQGLASVGTESWLAALAWGAARVMVVATTATPPRGIEHLRREIGHARDLLAALGHERDRLRLLAADDVGPDATVADTSPSATSKADFAAVTDKRASLFLALDALGATGAVGADARALAEGASLGEISLDAERCSLCMACVTLCPTGALEAGRQESELRFVESACVQCGLCVAGCPEKALALVPRIVPGRRARNQARTLHKGEMARCIECGRPFMPAALVRTIKARLANAGNANPGTLRLIETCPDCRTNLPLTMREVRPFDRR